MGMAQLMPSRRNRRPIKANVSLMLSLMKLKYLKNKRGSKDSKTPKVKTLLGCLDLVNIKAEK